jgi:hypothetical protein
VLWAGHPAHTMTTGGLLGLGEHPSRIYAPVSLVPSSKKSIIIMLPKEEKVKIGIYLLVLTSPITHTYLYSIDTKGTLGNDGIQDRASNSHASCPGLPYYTKQKNDRSSITTPRRLESREPRRKEQVAPVSLMPR